ncbi:MAG TPA: pyridoxal-phosphate dependent enzyme, partial [Chloroflexota bacterium]
WDVKVRGISVSRTASEQRAQVTNLANLTLAHLGYSLEVESDCVRVDDRYRGSGYGRPTDDAMDAILYAARDEGILLDPVYTAKCMAGLAGHAQEGRFGSGDIVVFVHTGGAPALFAYHAELRDLLDGSV